MTTQIAVLKYLEHFAILAGLGAASVIIVALLQVAGTLNVSSLPIVWQGISFLILPIIIAAGLKLKSEIDTELAAQLAAKQIEALESKNAVLSKQMKTSSSVKYADAPPAPYMPREHPGENFNTF